MNLVLGLGGDNFSFRARASKLTTENFVAVLCDPCICRPLLSLVCAGLPLFGCREALTCAVLSENRAASVPITKRETNINIERRVEGLPFNREFNLFLLFILSSPSCSYRRTVLWIDG